MPPTDASTQASTDTASASSSEDTLELRLTDDFLALLSEDGDSCGGRTEAGREAPPANGELLDHLADWGPVVTPAGTLHLVPVRLERELPLVSRWMNDSAVDSYWQLAGPEDVTANHLRNQLGGDGRSMPCLGMLNGTPMSYWEIYRADLDPSPATTPPARTTPGSISSSVPWPTGGGVSVPSCCAPSPISSSTDDPPVPASSRNQTFATSPPSPPS